MALRRIRRPGGNEYGLPLALIETFFFPILLANLALIGVLAASEEAGLILLAAAVVLAANVGLARYAWRPRKQNARNRLSGSPSGRPYARRWQMIGFPVGEIWTRSALDNHPPLHFYLLWGWAKVFGDSPQALRSLSVLLGLATVVAAYLLVRQIGSGIRENSVDDSIGIRENSGPTANPELSRVPLRVAELPALAAAALVALSPLQVDWSQQARMHVLGAALAVISSWLLLRALQAGRPRWRDFGWYALAAAGLAYTHYFGLFVLVGPGFVCRGVADGEHGGMVRRPSPNDGMVRRPSPNHR